MQESLNFTVTFYDARFRNIKGEVEQFEVTEQIGELPKFLMIVNLDTDPSVIGPAEFMINIKSAKSSINYRCTILQVEKNKYVQGVVLPKDTYFMRRSRSLTNSLYTALMSLKLRPQVDRTTITSIQPFLQLNETDAECFKRIADYCGVGTLWAITNKKVKIFDIIPKLIKDIPAYSDNEKYLLNSNRTFTKDLSQPFIIQLSKNLFYKTEDVPVPTSCMFSKDAIMSYLEKKKYKNWCNIEIIRDYPESIGEVGDAFKLPEFPMINAAFFINTATTVYNKLGTSFKYKLTCYKGWDAYFG
jgi:hypothetical protein